MGSFSDVGWVVYGERGIRDKGEGVLADFDTNMVNIAKWVLERKGEGKKRVPTISRVAWNNG